jgi:hypothetical protein
MNPFKCLSEETRDKLKALFFIIFFPIAGLIMLGKVCKGCNFEDFIDEWGVYLIMLCGWMLIVGLIGFIILGIIYNLVETLIVIGVILGILFLFLGIPYIVYRIANLK